MLASDSIKCLFQLIDRNHDNVISVSEWQTVFDLIDANGDGSISRKEWFGAQGESDVFDAIPRKYWSAVNRKEWNDAFKFLDKDGNGEISLNEWNKSTGTIGFQIKDEEPSEGAAKQKGGGRDALCDLALCTLCFGLKMGAFESGYKGKECARLTFLFGLKAGALDQELTNRDCKRHMLLDEFLDDGKLPSKDEDEQTVRKLVDGAKKLLSLGLLAGTLDSHLSCMATKQER